MINVAVYDSGYDRCFQCKQWLVDRGVRVIGWGGSPRGFNEVMVLPYVVRSKLHSSDAEGGYDYRFTDDLGELAMLFKLTWGGK